MLLKTKILRLLGEWCSILAVRSALTDRSFHVEWYVHHTTPMGKTLWQSEKFAQFIGVSSVPLLIFWRKYKYCHSGLLSMSFRAVTRNPEKTKRDYVWSFLDSGSEAGMTK